jgi:hypothetical protein
MIGKFVVTLNLVALTTSSAIEIGHADSGTKQL